MTELDPNISHERINLLRATFEAANWREFSAACRGQLTASPTSSGSSDALLQRESKKEQLLGLILSDSQFNREAAPTEIPKNPSAVARGFLVRVALKSGIEFTAEELQKILNKGLESDVLVQLSYAHINKQPAQAALRKFLIESDVKTIAQDGGGYVAKAFEQEGGAFYDVYLEHHKKLGRPDLFARPVFKNLSEQNLADCINLMTAENYRVVLDILSDNRNALTPDLRRAAANRFAECLATEAVYRAITSYDINCLALLTQKNPGILTEGNIRVVGAAILARVESRDLILQFYNDVQGAGIGHDNRS